MNKNTKDNTKLVSFATIVGSIVNIVLSGLKLGAGVLCNSATLIADGFHSLSDLVSDAAVIVGVRFWNADPDKDHPYGHGRIETLVTVLIALLIGGASLGIAQNAIKSLIYPSVDAVVTLQGFANICATCVAGISIISKEILFQWTARKAKVANSSALYANAWHHRSDAFSSIPAFIAICLTIVYPDVYYIDAIGALIVAAMLLVTAFKILLPALTQLTDKAAPDSICQDINALAMQIRGVRDAHAIRTRQFGQGYHVDLHVEVDPLMSVWDAHEICNQIEDAIKTNTPSIIDIVIHIEPYGEYNK